jgi:hypothetical protein
MTPTTYMKIDVFLFYVILAELSILCCVIGWQHRYEVWGYYTVFGFMGMLALVPAILCVVGAMSVMMKGESEVLPP